MSTGNATRQATYPNPETEDVALHSACDGTGRDRQYCGQFCF